MGGGWGAALGIGLGLACIGATIGPAPAGACSLAAVDVDFDGTVVRIDGVDVTYRVDEVRERGSDPDDGSVAVPAAGQEVVVAYDEPPTVLDVGSSYRVRGWSLVGGPGSQIAYDYRGDCGTGLGTSNLDGSYLAAAARPWWEPAGIAVAGIAAVAAVAVAIDRRRRRA